MNRVRQLRRSKGWSLARLARESAVSKSHLSSVERGKKEPTISVARRVARALGADLDHVFPAVPREAERADEAAPAWDEWDEATPTHVGEGDLS